MARSLSVGKQQLPRPGVGGRSQDEPDHPVVQKSAAVTEAGSEGTASSRQAGWLGGGLCHHDPQSQQLPDSWDWRAFQPDLAALQTSRPPPEPAILCTFFLLVLVFGFLVATTPIGAPAPPQLCMNPGRMGKPRPLPAGVAGKVLHPKSSGTGWPSVGSDSVLEGV